MKKINQTEYSENLDTASIRKYSHKGYNSQPHIRNVKIINQHATERLASLRLTLGQYKSPLGFADAATLQVFSQYGLQPRNIIRTISDKCEYDPLRYGENPYQQQE